MDIVYRAQAISTLWTDVYKYHNKSNVYCRDMENSLIQENNTVETLDLRPRRASGSEPANSSDDSEVVVIEEDTDTVNMYPVIRHAFLTLCILLAVAIILFLIYQNGKSIYDKGI